MKKLFILPIIILCFCSSNNPVNIPVNNLPVNKVTVILTISNSAYNSFHDYSVYSDGVFIERFIPCTLEVNSKSELSIIYSCIASDPNNLHIDRDCKNASGGGYDCRSIFKVISDTVLYL